MITYDAVCLACQSPADLHISKVLICCPTLSLFQVPNKGEIHFEISPYERFQTVSKLLKSRFLSTFQGSPTNNVSPTSTPAKSSNAVPTLQPPPAASGEGAAAAAAPEPAEE